MLAKSYIEGVEFEADLSLHLRIPFSVLPTSLPQAIPQRWLLSLGKISFPAGPPHLSPPAKPLLIRLHNPEPPAPPTSWL